MAAVRLLGHVALTGENFSLTTRDLLASRSDFSLQVVVRSVLLIKEETGVVDFLLKAAEGEDIGVVASLEVVILEQLLVLQVSVLGLDGVQLVPQGEVVLVALLNFEDLGLELRDEQVFLVAGEMHAVVVLPTKNNS